ncbi:hypothetical protein ASZ90_011375 [hydrocarbon metagenome]|uniref:Uncharacterized protein n=1 Tax=hydrocarbon metagenome TaxID=938273 RepID=A0A0W8FDN6_9ZZZZ|nr:hypothetical protein [Methanomicrobiaceae archaeon]
MTIDEFVSRIAGRRRLNPRQQGNLNRILAISDRFSRDAGIPQSEPEQIGADTIVLESGHQPNFLPFPGVWRKAFLLDRIRKRLQERGHDTIAVFGFADQNQSTASLLAANQIPAFKKGGRERIGFAIREKDRWRRFDAIPKPDPEDWQAEISKIEAHYIEHAQRARLDPAATKARLGAILEVLRQSHERAENFPDANAFFFARISAEAFGLDVRFFRYSDLQQAGIFAEETNELRSHREGYVRHYNAAIAERSLNIPPVRTDHVPLWYHCACGGKVALATGDEGTSEGTCPACGTPATLDNISLPALEAHYGRIGLSAVARNIVFAEGLGTSLFLSGAGGGLQYGQIADRISRELGLPVPETLAWPARDCYLGAVQRIALLDLIKTFDLESREVADGLLAEKIEETRAALRQEIARLKETGENRKRLKQYEGRLKDSATRTAIVAGIFAAHPSIADLFACMDPDRIIAAWDDAATRADFRREGDFCIMHAPILYDNGGFQQIEPRDLPQVCRHLASLEAAA